MSTFQQEVNETQEWFDGSRFDGITRLYSADQVVEQRGTIQHDYTIARTAAEAFYPRSWSYSRAGRASRRSVPIPRDKRSP